MAKFDYFSGASSGWRERVAGDVDDILELHGNEAETYIEKQIKRSSWGSYRRRRWVLARSVLQKLRRTSHLELK